MAPGKKNATTKSGTCSGDLPAVPPFLLSSRSSTTQSSSLTSTTGLDDDPPPPTFEETFDGVARLLRGRKNIVVLVGAGISTSCGIPDFRSQDSGLYHSLDLPALGLSEPEDLFCYEFFRDNPVPFYQFARNLYYPLGMSSTPAAAAATTTTAPNTTEPAPNSITTTTTTTTVPPRRTIQPSDSHKLLALLEQKRMLLRVYTQNIDGLEHAAGVSEKKIVYAHGSLQWATCLKCNKRVKSDEILPDIERGSVARCRRPVKSNKTTKKPLLKMLKTTTSKGSNKSGGGSGKRTQDDYPLVTTVDESLVPPRPPSQRIKKRSRTASTSSVATASSFGNVTSVDQGGGSLINHMEGLCGGVMKPAVTFFGETLNDTVRRALEADRDKADALIVIGTSLSVAPISRVIEYLPPTIPRILINRTMVHPSSTTSSDGGGDGSDETPDFDFRGDNYFFDAYLLGFCDDVTRALARQVFKGDVGSTESPDKKRRRQTTTAVQNQHAAGLLTNALQGKEKDWKPEEWSSISVPAERVLLFPGALGSQDVATSAVYSEVAHCDGCSKQIRGVIMKCAVCFDYDLCSKCYPLMSKQHFGGEHFFTLEKANPF